MSSPSDISLLLWSESVVPYLSPKDLQAFRATSHHCLLIITTALPGYILRLEAIVTELSHSLQPTAELSTEAKAAAEAKIASVMPQLQAAVQTIQALSKSDITKLKTLKSPPAAVQETVEMLRVLLGMPQGRNPFASAEILSELLSFDRNRITPKVSKALGKYVSKYPVALVQKASLECGKLCQFLGALHTYALVMQELQEIREPPKNELTAVIEAMQKEVEICKRLDSKKRD